MVKGKQSFPRGIGWSRVGREISLQRHRDTEEHTRGSVAGVGAAASALGSESTDVAERTEIQSGAVRRVLAMVRVVDYRLRGNRSLAGCPLGPAHCEAACQSEFPRDLGALKTPRKTRLHPHRCQPFFLCVPLCLCGEAKLDAAI